MLDNIQNPQVFVVSNTKNITVEYVFKILKRLQ